MYCGLPLDYSGGESDENDPRVPVPCAHGGCVHSRCMLDSAEHPARGHVDPRPCFACRSAWPGGSRPPHSAALARGLSMNGHEGRWGVVRGALQFAARAQLHISGLESASYVTPGNTFELVLCERGRSPTSSFFLFFAFRDALGLPQGAYLDFPGPREWDTAAGRYRTLFAAYAIQPQDILLRLPNQRLYIEPHDREYLVGLDAEYEERPTRWTLGVRSALEAGDALPPFSAAMTATPERTDRTLENEHLHTGPAEQRGTAKSVAERRHTAGNRGASPCAYCGR